MICPLLAPVATLSLESTSDASIVMSALNRRETAHPSLARVATSRNGRVDARHGGLDVEMNGRDGTAGIELLHRHVAAVSMRRGSNPASPSRADSAMEKQPACAAPMSSSGLVPGASSKRVVKEYFRLDSAPLPVEMLPVPFLSPPLQRALALRFMIHLPVVQPGCSIPGWARPPTQSTAAAPSRAHPGHRRTGVVSALALTGRLWWRHWPQLVLLVLVRVLAGRFLINGAVEVGLHNRLLGLCALSVPVLLDLLVFVAMFHVLKPSLPLLGRPGGPLPIQGPGEARREAFLDGLTLVLVPFFAYYAAWGLLGDTRARYSLRALEQMDPFTQQGSILDVLGAPGLIAAVAVIWLVRRGLKALDARRHRAVWKLLITLCEATWLFIGLFVFNAWKGKAVEWWHSRAAYGWWDAVVQWSGVRAALAASLARGLAALRDVTLYAALPLVWLAMTALVYGRELGRAEELATADSRLGASPRATGDCRARSTGPRSIWSRAIASASSPSSTAFASCWRPACRCWWSSRSATARWAG